MKHDAHRLVAAMRRLREQKGMTWKELEEKSGVDKSTLQSWGVDRNPSVFLMECALQALGWTLMAVPKEWAAEITSDDPVWSDVPDPDEVEEGE